MADFGLGAQLGQQQLQQGSEARGLVGPLADPRVASLAQSAQQERAQTGASPFNQSQDFLHEDANRFQFEGNQIAAISKFAPIFRNAVNLAENDKLGKGGVRSEPVSTALGVKNIQDNSLENNLSRWIQSGSSTKFADFFARRWAPIGAKNDPDNLNENFPGNLKSHLKKQLTEEDIKLLEDNNIF